VRDELLCHGSTVRKSVDGDAYKQRVSPRRPTSIWSQIIKRVAVLTPGDAYPPVSRPSTAAIAPGLLIRTGPAGWAGRRGRSGRTESLDVLPCSHHTTGVTGWVMSAKKEETRHRRLERLIRDSAAGRRIGMLAATKKK
jgi:hypothetical protein